MENYFKENHNKIKLWKSFPNDYPAHFHESIEIIFVLRGTATAYYNGTVCPLSQGSIFFLSPNIIHAYKDKSRDYCHMLLLMNPRELSSQVFSFLSENIPDIPVWQDSQKDSHIWNLIELANDMQSSVTQETLTLLLSAIVSLILENISFKKSVEGKQSIRQILDYCRNHFQEPVSLRLLSETLHFSESYISHSFSNMIGISLPEYLNGLRLNEAVRLMKITNMSITEISIQSGFPTTRTFNRVFMKQYGIPPTKFRKRNK